MENRKNIIIGVLSVIVIILVIMAFRNKTKYDQAANNVDIATKAQQAAEQKLAAYIAANPGSTSAYDAQHGRG